MPIARRFAPAVGTSSRVQRRGGWQRRLRQAPWFRRGKLFLKRLIGREPWLQPDVAVPLRYWGDWAYDPQRLTAGDVVYALGVGVDLGMERELIHAHTVEVHAFDPSPECLRWIAGQQLPAALHFHPIGVAGTDGTLRLQARATEHGDTPVMYSVAGSGRTGPVVHAECLALTTLVGRLGHARIALLKVDVEGAEYDILAGMLAAGMHPAQLLVEFHHRFPGLGRARTESAVAALRAAGYRLAFIADTGREFTFLHEG